MTTYQHILAAVDLTDESAQVLEHAQQIARENGAQLSVLTVIRPITYGYAGLDTGWVSKDMVNFETESQNYASKRLAELAEAVGVPATNTQVVLGAPAHTIKAEAEAMGADLIVLGTHSRHGLGLILGSTANGVLHGASCDVLAVKISTTQAQAA